MNKHKSKNKHKQVTRTPVDEYDIRGDMDMTSLLSSARMTSLLDGEQQHQMHGDGRDEDSHIHRIETATTAGSSPSNSSVFAGLELERSNKSSPSSVGAGVRAGVGLNVSPSVSNRNDTHAHAHAHGPIDKRDAYVRSGTHFRTLLDNAMKKVAIGFSNTNTGEIEVALTNETDDGGTGTDVVGERSEYEHEHEHEHERRRKRRGGLESRAPRKRRLNEYGDIHDDCDNDERQNSFYSGNNHKHASELAREKVAEVMSLKRALKEAEDHSKAMCHANSALRDASTISSARLATLSEALRIAGEKAANARADADAAEAKASSLVTQLKSFKNALDETKHTVESIRTEHDDISSVSRDLERKLLQRESELQRLQKQKQKSDEENATIGGELENLKKVEEMLNSTIEKRDDEVLKLKKALAERENVESARLERTDRLENELSKARSMLIEMTSAAADGESTAAELRDTIEALQNENKSLHQKIEKAIGSSSKERAKLQQALAHAENEAQKLRLKEAVDDEDFQKLRLDKISSEKEVIQLKDRLSNLERRFTEASAVGVISPSDAISDISSIKTNDTPSYKTPKKSISSIASIASQDYVNIPRLKAVCGKVAMIPPVALENIPTKNFRSSNIGVSHKSKGLKRQMQYKCSICFKAPYGIMKSCQCGNPLCDMRAHVSCISGKNPLPSVSHPGTPAPSLPAILCNKK